MNWNWIWAKAPRPMQRTFADDVKVAVFFLVGATLGCLVLGNGDLSPLLGSVIGVVLLTVVLNVLRHLRRRRNA